MGRSKLYQLVARLHLPRSGGGGVPRGHLAVYVGEGRRRYVIPTWYLKQPAFVTLLQRAEEEFGFHHPCGGLTIPCAERDFAALLDDLGSSS